MEIFIPGQRWISTTESELGLGLILEATNNRVTVLFLASNEKRIYARDNAPLTRVLFTIGDLIESVKEERLKVISWSEAEGLITYTGRTESGLVILLKETELNHHIQFNKPQDRLISGQIDPSPWFKLRYQTWLRLQQLQQSPVKGLLGGRTALIAHQLYIAHEASNRSAPRIMLADEVGLGKTIEAGLILHYRLINGLSQRALIIVPESLVHQWLVEMLRRFNLRFSVFDEDRCLHAFEDIDGESPEPPLETDSEENPFQSEQLILCSQGFFSSFPNRQQQVLAAGWDIVIIDEAHHLEWSETTASPDYLFVEQLSQVAQGLILLTATPEQLGKESHFARLRLLDPDRFYSFAAYLSEEQQFEPVARAAQLLLMEQPLDATARKNLIALLKEDDVDSLLKDLENPSKSNNARAALVDILLDHHGTGRILFRNSRHTVQGFPAREYSGYPLTGQPSPKDMQKDPQFIWLVEKIKALKEQKALLICKHAQTAIELEKTLKNRAGIASALFHEGMSIIERDRAAAYFADDESSARLLICSEIGSEGRNFQFVHHLILFDLPTNPDLLQQRIGRLDRIGQKHIIQIHVPYFLDSGQHKLFRWYDEGLNAFSCNNSAAQPVADLLNAELVTELNCDHGGSLDAFIAKTKALSEKIAAQLHHGRDQLLELNSCRKKSAESLIDALVSYENEGALWPYMEDLFECYGVDTEFHSPDCYIIRPSEHLRVSHFPGLQEDGMTVTVNRQIALAREDLAFFTWEHPLVAASMDMVLTSETGNAAISVIKHNQLKGGQFLLECLFIIECSAPAALQIGRFLPHTVVRVLINQNQIDLSETYGHADLIETGITFDKGQIVLFLSKQRPLIGKLIALAEQKAKSIMQKTCNDAEILMMSFLTAEINRLIRLKKVNPSIKSEEIDHLKEMTLMVHDNIQAAQLKLDAVRFIITS
jgi:ATP-dependent helicase HepA